MNVLHILQKRREGSPHSEEELQFLARGAATGEIPDYQLAAWLMAAVLQPLSPQETAWLTMAMAHSGQVMDLSALPQPCIDKHSTGGVGDKTSIVLLPLLAACGITIVKMSGRGLGITGGTVDKLESIPGFRMDLSPAEMLAQAGRIGVAVTGSTAELAPADKTLYALRDATSTVASIPLIVSSILSKKIAGGAKTVVLDVKCGRGSFMPNLDEAEKLARALKETGELCGLHIRTAITEMCQPLGRAVGNALEVREALEVLGGDVRTRFAQLCIQLAGLAIHASGHVRTPEEGRTQAEEAIVRGMALEKAEEWFAAQGANPAVARTGVGLPEAPYSTDIRYAGPAGWIAGVDAREVGGVAVELGAGRKHKGDDIDPAVGIEVLAAIGNKIESGQVAFRVHHRAATLRDALSRQLQEAISVLQEPISAPPLVFATY